MLSSNWFTLSSSNVLPLRDLFRNRKVEFNYSLDDIKLFYANLKLQKGNNFKLYRLRRWDACPERCRREYRRIGWTIYLSLFEIHRFYLSLLLVFSPTLNVLTGQITIFSTTVSHPEYPLTIVPPVCFPLIHCLIFLKSP